jgi:lysophospholipase L1-like esterase
MPSILFRVATYVHVRKRLHDLHSLFLSKIYSKPLVHVIGDSHIVAYKRINLFITHYVGPATAYNLYSQSSKTKSNAKLFRILKKINKKRDILVLVFGEIDSRMHIYYQYMKQGRVISMSQLIDKTIQNYNKVLELIEKEGFSFFVYGIPPAARLENVYHFPFYADEETRVIISREFNEKLKEFCARKKYRYLDIQSKFADESGFISKAFAADRVHLNETAAAIMADEIRIKAGLET